MRRIFLLISILIFSLRAHSFYTEIGASYSFQRQVYGDSYESKINDNTVLATVALYFFSLTAVELTYSWNKWDNLNKTISEIQQGSDIWVTGNRTTVDIQNFGIGITQAFNSTKAFLRPMIGLGIVRRLTENTGYVDYYDNGKDESIRLDKVTENTNNDLLYASIILKLRIVEGLFLSTSLRTLFAPKKYTEAQNNLRFFVGFSWLL